MSDELTPAPEDAPLLQREQDPIRLAAIVESSYDAIISKTLDGIVLTWNKAAERIFGYTASEMIGKPIAVLVPPDRPDEEPQILARLSRGERIEQLETVRLRKDGTRIDVSVTSSPIRDASGRIVGASKIARDITDRRVAEAAVREESRILELLNETGRLIAAETRLEQVVQAVTDAATRITGARFGAFFYNVVDASGEAFLLYTLSGAPREAFSHLGLPRNTPVFGPTFRGEGVVRSDDITKDPRYGTMAPHHGMPAGHVPLRSYLAASVISRSGAVIGGLFFGHPEVGVFPRRIEAVISGIASQAAIAIDNARLYEQTRSAAVEKAQLLEAERAARGEAERASLQKDEFLSTLSHELRTPLNAILGWAQLLHGKGGEQLTHGLHVIERNARAQAQLVEDLLDMSRIISGKMRLDVQRIELHDLLRAAIETVRYSAEAKGVRLEVILDPVATMVRGDATRLQQCVWNLLSNAIKFTPRGGKVQVALERVNSHIEIVVSDTGDGIAPEFLPHVFERFRQADASTTRTRGGLGLGLAITKQLVELHGGFIRVKSPGIGRGSTFAIAMPLVVGTHDDGERRAHPRDSSLSLGGSDHPSLEGLSVLVVEDEADSRDLIAQLLQSCGAHVAAAGNGPAALDAMRTARFDLMLSDIGLPEMDGYELIARVRALPAEQGGKTPAIAVTAFARTEDRTRALRAGYQSHIAKPLEPTELTAMVASLAGR